MLVLSRKPNESIVLLVNGIEIVVSIGKFNGNAVSVGITAPQEVKILRKELRKCED